MRHYRNPHKSNYYLAYSEFVLNHETGPEPNHSPLSVMGAQAVQLNVRDDLARERSLKLPIDTGS